MIKIFQITTYWWELLEDPAAKFNLVAEELAPETPDSGTSHESKCISIAISKFPLQASSIDLAISLEAPVTLTNCSMTLEVTFILVAILNCPPNDQSSAGNLFHWSLVKSELSSRFFIYGQNFPQKMNNLVIGKTTNLYFSL